MVLGPGFDLGTATGRIILDASGVGAGVREAQNVFQGGITQIGQMVGGLGRQMSSLGSSLTTLTAPLSLGFGFGIKAATEFDSSMREISARTGLVGADLQKVSDFALKMGADTVFSAGESADAFLQLLSSGQSASEAIATLPAVLNLAAASGDDLGRTADVVTDIMAAYGLNVTDAASVTDSLARAAASSSADVSSLGEGFANVGGVARQFGLDVDQTAAVLAIFAERGIKGAEAGTQLKSMLMNMTRDTPEVNAAWATLGTSMYDAEGNMRNLNDVMDDIRVAMQDMTPEQQVQLFRDLGGSYGFAGLQALVAGQNIDEMQGIMAGQADAATIAQQQMASFQNTLNSLMGSAEALAITVLTPFINDVLKPMVAEATKVVNKITEWANENPELAGTIVRILAVAAILGPVLVIVGGALQAMAPIIVLVGALLGLLLSPIGLVILGVALLAAAWATNWNNIRDKVAEIMPDLEGQLRTFRLTIEEQLINGLPQIFGTNNTPFDQVRIIVQDKLWSAFGDFTFSGIARNIRLTIEEAITNEFPVIFGTNNTPFDQVRIIVQDKLTTEFGDFELSEIDTTNVTTWANDNAQAILDAVVGAVGIILGGPIGATIGAAKLIKAAIEGDFLGFGTFIEESGIRASVESGVQALRGIIEGAFQSLLGGGGDTVNAGQALAEDFASGMAVQAAPESNPITDSLTRIINGIKRGIELFTPEIQESLTQIGNGISGFISGLSGADTSGLALIAASVIDFIGNIAGIAGTLITLGLDIITDIFENVMPKIGEAISNLISLISAVVNGDAEGVMTAVGNGIGSLIGAITGAVAGFADPLIQAINTLTGGNLPMLSTLFDDAKTAIQGVWDKVVEAIQPIIDTLAIMVNYFVDEETGVASVVKWINETFNTAIAGAQSVLIGIWDAVKGPLETFKTELGKIFNWIKTNVIDPFKRAVQDVIDLINQLSGYNPNDFQFPTETAPTAPGQAILPNHDYAGAAYAGVAYGIGVPEVFVPQDNGYILPIGGAKLGNTYNVSVVMPEAALEQPDRARAIGQDFAQAIIDELDRL